MEEAISAPRATLRDILLLAYDANMPVDILKRELTRDTKCAMWLEQQRIMLEVLQLLTMEPQSSAPMDPEYGAYRVQHFCCEIALWYPRRTFQRKGARDVDLSASAPFWKALFEFVCTTNALDDVLVVLFCKVVNHFVLNHRFGPVMLEFFASEGQNIVPWLVRHMDSDSIRDMLVWLLYSDLTEVGQQHVWKSRFWEHLLTNLHEWQRLLSYGEGTSFHRDAINNICALLKYVVCPPAIYVVEGGATFVESANDPLLPLITDPYVPSQHNELLKSLLLFFRTTSHITFGTLVDLGFTELVRQSTQQCAFLLQDGGSLSVVMNIVRLLGYQKRQRDNTGIKTLLEQTKSALLQDLAPRLPKFVQLAHAVIEKDEEQMRQVGHFPQNQRIRLQTKGLALHYLIAFLKLCVLMQDACVNEVLAEFGLMPCLLDCYSAYPTNSLLHHELTDVIRFVLMDPDQKRSPTCPLLQSLFVEPANLLDFVIKKYADPTVQYKGHLTTIANSIITLTT